MSRLADTYHALPRAARWGLITAGALAVYFAIVEPVIDTTASLNARAQARADALEQLRSGSGGPSDLGVRLFGNVEPPGDPRERTVAFNRGVLEVLEKHSVRDHTSTTRQVPLASGPLLASLAPTNQRVERLVREVQFEASPETVAAVIADLERTPEVAAVSRVQLRKPDEGGRIVRASVSVEAWLLSRKGGSR